ncbi:hypothetical protein [Caballeronia sp. LZ019]|uniref:hypothetical protein n=1 Tax=Caballeronia sp. LZ019 TaxID=3038555 RepID=UPI0028594C76|nr:hypothetical protein [Caballeronia sp. LZ019]MDR5811503.1 hypothetical protein [Caballeronia sp. LZ019]
MIQVAPSEFASKLAPFLDVARVTRSRKHETPLTTPEKQAIRRDPFAHVESGGAIDHRAIYLPYCRDGRQYVPIDGRPDLAAVLKREHYAKLCEAGYRPTRWHLVDGQVRLVKQGDDDSRYSAVAVLYDLTDGDTYHHCDGNPLNLLRGNLNMRRKTPGVAAKLCLGCNARLPAPSFKRDSRSKDGLMARCAGCTNASRQNRAFMQKGMEAWREQQAAHAAQREADRAAGIKPRRKTRAELKAQREAELASIPKTGKAFGMLARFGARQSL